MSRNRQDNLHLLVGLVGLVAGALITGGVSYVVEDKKLAVARVEALAKFQPYIISNKMSDRIFAYEALHALGYIDLADSMKKLSLKPTGVSYFIKHPIQKDQADEYIGRTGLIQLSAVYIEKQKPFPNSTEIRFFNEVDEDIARTIATKIGGSTQIRLVQDCTASHGNIEVWVSTLKDN